MTIEHDEDLEGLRRAGAAVAAARDAMAAAIAPGVTTAELDEVGRGVLRAHGARSAPQLAYGLPGTTCISVNDEIAHGIPSARRLRSGDLVNVDVSAELDGYWADCGASHPVGDVGTRPRLLLWATKKAQEEAMDVARAGAPLRGIGRAVEQRAKRHGLRVVRNLGGHGVGRHIHEAPHVSNVEDRFDRTRLWAGLVITIEPFLTTGATRAIEDDDGWTLRTPDRSLGAQFEHTLVVTDGAPIVLTS
jgi:methionyl aminopeptidase